MKKPRFLSALVAAVAASSVHAQIPTPPTAPWPSENVLTVGVRDARDELVRVVSATHASKAEIVAARMRLDEAQGQARRAAVKYLANADCHYYEDAEAALIAALRTDRIEAVRLEAAHSIGECRGVTVKMLDALNFAALGLEADGHPAETSEAVRKAAAASLNRCLMRGIEQPAPQPQPAIMSINPAAKLPAKAEERRSKESVSAVGAPVDPQTTQPRSLIAFFATMLQPYEPIPANASPAVQEAYLRRATALRMRGLTPVNSDSSLAIPAAAPGKSAVP